MESGEPFAKRQRVENKDVSLNKLPELAIEKILSGLSVTDRLRMERVDWYWNETVWKFGWKSAKKLDYDVVFEGADRVNFGAFSNESLVALFKRMGENLIELDLFLESSEVCSSLHLLPKLSKIDIVELLDLSLAVPFLPSTLSEIRFSVGYNEATLLALAEKCPNLMGIEIFIGYNQRITVSSINDFLRNYPRLKKLCLGCSFIEGSGKLTSTIGELKELVEFKLPSRAADAFEEETLEALIENCKHLRLLAIDIDEGISVSEETFRGIAMLSGLEVLALHSGHPNITDSVLKAISKCRNLKKLDISCRTKSEPKLTDDSVVYLVKHCKLLVSLNVMGCPLVTDKTLEAVVAEVKRRHGDPPKTLPKGPLDDGIFHFPCKVTAIDFKKAFKAIADNPWIDLDFPDVDDEENDDANDVPGEGEEEMSSGSTFVFDEEQEFSSSSTEEELDQEH